MYSCLIPVFLCSSLTVLINNFSVLATNVTLAPECANCFATA